MQIAVLGATGRTGRHVVGQALQRGHRVAAVARQPEALEMRDQAVTLVAADVLEPDGLADALGGCDAVVSALGVGTSRAPTRLYSEGISNALKAMKAASIDRIAVTSAAPVAPREAQPLLERRLLMPLLDRFFGATYEDMRRMERLLAESTVSWVALRPPRLIDRSGLGAYRVDAQRPLPRARSIRCPDLASALLDVLDGEDLHGRAAYVAN